MRKILHRVVAQYSLLHACYLIRVDAWVDGYRRETGKRMIAELQNMPTKTEVFFGAHHGCKTKEEESLSWRIAEVSARLKKRIGTDRLAVYSMKQHPDGFLYFEDYHDNLETV